MKKLIALLLVCLMILSLAACNKSTPKTPAATDTEQSAAPADAADSSDVASQDNSGGLITIDEDPETTPATSEPDAAEENVSEEDDNHTTCNSIEEVNQRTGGKIARPTNVELPFEQFEVVTSGEAEIGQYVFEAGGVPCGVRFCSDFNLCISDMLNEDGTLLFEGSHEEETVTYNGSTAAHWETVDGQYILVVASEDETFFNSLYEEIRAASVPGDV